MGKWVDDGWIEWLGGWMNGWRSEWILDGWVDNG